ncbi:hypothetical protein Pint_05367 [Pistacia integerrima]|uniref:Uncharacterized protein n=1 Tax=Pistacia integerrima TaxID=434235 RepID=A0ACC0Z6R3_9ROSI|nr:hypothetical protein Pint_05367 [Pistacia integerrima]
MVRPYTMKGHKRKKKSEEDKYDGEGEEEEEVAEEQPDGFDEKDDQGQEEEAVHEMEGIPIGPSNRNAKKPGVIFVLEKASLEVAKVGKSYQILNLDGHANFLKRNNKNPGDYRPDTVHQALLSILDSPLIKAGRLRAVYVKTEKVQLLLKLSITAAGKREKLLRVIKNPVTQYLPVNSQKIGFSYSSEKWVKMRNHVATISDDMDLVFVVGAMANGKIQMDY